MKEGAARAVLRETWFRGHRSVELQRDGRQTIFVCTRCDTRCYSDAALVDHLHGNLHSRLSAAFTSEKNYSNRTSGDESVFFTQGRKMCEDRGTQVGMSAPNCSGMRGESQIVLTGLSGVAGPSETLLERIGSVELFFSVRSAGSAPVVDASWFSWKGKGKQDSQPGWEGGAIIYAVVIFPYSDMIGRGGDGKPSLEAKHARSHASKAEDRIRLTLPCRDGQSSSPEANVMCDYSDLAAPEAKLATTAALTAVGDDVFHSGLEMVRHSMSEEISNRVFRRAWKRKKAKVFERLCFICHQKMTSGKDVAALLNLQTEQMVCGSRNKRGVFHVYHSCCLIDWICVCEVKTFTGVLDHRIDHTRKFTRTRCAVVEQSLEAGFAVDGGSLSNSNKEGAVFCPECQGTGLKVHGTQLERPRYRLAQVFDWILELIQARKAWTKNPKKRATSLPGLLFLDELQGAVKSRGLVLFYSRSADIVAGNAFDPAILGH